MVFDYCWEDVGCCWPEEKSESLQSSRIFGRVLKGLRLKSCILHRCLRDLNGFWLVLMPRKKLVNSGGTAFDDENAGGSNGAGLVGAGGRRKPYVFLFRNPPAHG